MVWLYVLRVSALVLEVMVHIIGFLMIAIPIGLAWLSKSLWPLLAVVPGFIVCWGVYSLQKWIFKILERQEKEIEATARKHGSPNNIF